MSNSLQIIDQGVLPWEAIPDLYENETRELISPIVGQISTILSSQTINLLEKAHFKATLYWLQTYQPSNSSLDEIVKGYLDAFHHLVQVENWTIAYQIFSLRLPLLPDYIFYENLGIWGYYREQINMGEVLFSKISDEVDCLCLLETGNAYCDLGEYQKALDYYQQLLDFATQINNQFALCQAYGGYAKVYDKSYKADLAIEYFKKQLKLSQELKLLSEEIIALVGLVIWSCEKTKSDITARKNQMLLNELFARIEEVKDRKSFALVYAEIGLLFIMSNDYKKAVDYLQKSLDFSNKIYYKTMALRSISWLGISQAMSVDIKEGTENIDEALLLIQKTLYLIQKTGDLFSEMALLNNLAVICYRKFKKYEEAVFYLGKALKISEFLDHQVAKSYILAQLAFHHTRNNNDDLSAQCLDQALAIAKQENSKPALALVFAIKANAYWLKGNYLKAMILLIRSLIILPPWRSTNGNLIWQRFLELLEQKFPFLKPILK